ncbi:MAG: hypothetical protein PHD20_05360 [Clostridia bacterium]|nr:hypothetical protein [Clostridia bacterium]
MDEMSKLKDEVRSLKVLNEIYARENERLKHEYRMLYDSKNRSVSYKVAKKIYNLLRRIKRRLFYKKG